MMPVRSKGIAQLCRSLNGSVVYNNVNLTATVNGKSVNREQFWRKHERGYDELIASIDWNRVCIEASALHLTRQQINPEHKTEADDYGDEICPDCIARALMADETFVDWDKLARQLDAEGIP